MDTDDYDSPWKEVLSACFKDFLAFFYPAAASGVNWEKGYTFLDKELQQVSRDAELGRRYADKLVRLWEKTGEETWVLVHYDLGFDREKIITLFRFIDWVMRLPEAMEESFWEEIRRFEEENHMPYVTSVEKIGIKRGIKEGLQKGIQQGIHQGMSRGLKLGRREGLLEGIEMVLTIKFGAKGLRLWPKIQRIENIDQLETVKEALKAGRGLKEIEKMLLSS